MKLFKLCIIIILIIVLLSGCLDQPSSEKITPVVTNDRFTFIESYELKIDDFRTSDVYVYHDNVKNLTIFMTYGSGGEGISVLTDYQLEQNKNH